LTALLLLTEKKVQKMKREQAMEGGLPSSKKSLVF